MHHILAQRHRRTLGSFACSNVLLAFDYDGTLAPIVSDPARASMRRTTRRLLKALAKRYPCVVISGRSRQDVVRRLAGVPLFAIVGNHGVEPWAEPNRYSDIVSDWTETLAARLASEPGVVLEDKGYSVTVHYRGAANRLRARAAIDRAVRGLRGVRRIDGIATVNLVPRGAPNKGVALEHLRGLLACDVAVYVGDDETDEDAFGSARRDRLLAVRVGARRGSKAQYRLDSQEEIDTFLQLLLDLRAGQEGNGARRVRR